MGEAVNDLILIIEDKLCWFCKKYPMNPAVAYKLTLHLEETVPSTAPLPWSKTELRFSKKHVQVPRCRACSRQHETNNLKMIALWAVVAGLGYWATLDSMEPGKKLGWVFVWAVAGMLPVGLIAWFASSRGTWDGYAEEHPVIQSMLADGWKTTPSVNDAYD